MIQYRVFTGTLEQIEAAFNGWAASLPTGVSVNAGPLTPVFAASTVELGEREYLKEVLYVLPARGNGIVPAKLVNPAVN